MKTTDQHTPGPGEIDRKLNIPADEIINGDYYAHVSSRNHNWAGLVSVVVRLHDHPEEYSEGRANARLIAAAPDLLDALRDLVFLAEKVGWRHGGTERAQEVIARATGAQSAMSNGCKLNGGAGCKSAPLSEPVSPANDVRSSAGLGAAAQLAVRLPMGRTRARSRASSTVTRAPAAKASANCARAARTSGPR